MKRHSTTSLDKVYGFGGTPKPRKRHHVEGGAPSSPIISMGPLTPQTSPTGSTSGIEPAPASKLQPPTFTPNGGVTAGVNVVLASNDSGAHIFYTLGTNPATPTHSGDTPTGTTARIGTSSGTVNSGAGGNFFKAIAYKAGKTDSNIAQSNMYGSPPPPGQLHVPTFTPNSSVDSNQNVTLSCVDSGAHLFYTIGVDPPGPVNPTHTGDTPIAPTIRIGSSFGVVNSGSGVAKIKALAYQSGFTDSDIGASGDYGTTPSTLKPILTGLAHLLPSDNSGQFDINAIKLYDSWTLPYIDAFRYRGTWGHLQPGASTFFWDDLDTIFGLCDTYGKFLSVNLAAGKQTPQWVYDAGCQKYAVHDPSAADGLLGAFQPVPWEPLYQTLWFQFLDAFKTRYGNNDKLRAMFDAGFMLQVSLELGDTYDEGTSAGWTPMPLTGTGYSYPDILTAYTAGMQTILAGTFSRFPNIAHALTETLVWVGDTVGGRAAENAAKDFYYQRNGQTGHPEYVGRTGPMITSARGYEPQLGAPPLANRSAAPLYAQQFGPMTTLIPNRFPTAYYVEGHAPAAYPGGLICLDDCLEYQWYLGKQYLECYIGDIDSSLGTGPTFSSARTKLISNLLPPP